MREMGKVGGRRGEGRDGSYQRQDVRGGEGRRKKGVKRDGIRD